MVHAGRRRWSEEEISGLLATNQGGRLLAGPRAASPRGTTREDYFNAGHRHVRLERRPARGGGRGQRRRGWCSPPSSCGGSAARSSSSTASRTAPSPITSPIPRWRRTSATRAKSRERQGRRGIAYDGRRPTAWGSSTSRAGATCGPHLRCCSPVTSSTRMVDVVRRPPQVLIRRHSQARRASVMWKTGHSHSAQMREDGILLGARSPEHVLRGETGTGWTTAFLASCKFLDAGARETSGVGALSTPCPASSPRPSSRRPARRQEVRGGGGARREFKRRYGTVDIDGGARHLSRRLGARARLQHNPYLTLRFEAKSQPALEACSERCTTALRRYPRGDAARLA